MGILNSALTGVGYLLTFGGLAVWKLVGQALHLL